MHPDIELKEKTISSLDTTISSMPIQAIQLEEEMSPDNSENDCILVTTEVCLKKKYLCSNDNQNVFKFLD